MTNQYPFHSGDFTVHGPATFSRTDDESILSFKGDTYYHEDHLLNGVKELTELPALDPQTMGNDDQDADDEPDSRLVAHARHELELLGEDEATVEWYLSVVRAFAAFGHSGGSAHETTEVLYDLLRFRNLKPITNDPDEWNYIDPKDYGLTEDMWQNKRNPAALSDDGGLTYYYAGKRGEAFMSEKVVDVPREASSTSEVEKAIEAAALNPFSAPIPRDPEPALFEEPERVIQNPDTDPTDPQDPHAEVTE